VGGREPLKMEVGYTRGGVAVGPRGTGQDGRHVVKLWSFVECGGGDGGEGAVRFVVIAGCWSSGCGWSWRFFSVRLARTTK